MGCVDDFLRSVNGITMLFEFQMKSMLELFRRKKPRNNSTVVRCPNCRQGGLMLKDRERKKLAVEGIRELTEKNGTRQEKMWAYIDRIERARRI